MDNSLRNLKIIHAAFVGSGLVYLVIAFALSRGFWRPIIGDIQLRDLLFYILLAASIVVAAIAVKWKDRASSFGDQQQAMSRAMFSFAFAEAPAIFALVYFLLSGSMLRMAILWFISFIAFLLLKPSE